jgi:hypothetical protein
MDPPASWSPDGSAGQAASQVAPAEFAVHVPTAPPGAEFSAHGSCEPGEEGPRALEKARDPVIVHKHLDGKQQNNSSTDQ